MLEQVQSTSLSEQGSVLQKQDKCKDTKAAAAWSEKSQYHFSKTRLKDAASQKERVSVWQSPGELLLEFNMLDFLRWTRQQIQTLSSDWDSEAKWVPTEEPSSKTLLNKPAQQLFCQKP